MLGSQFNTQHLEKIAWTASPIQPMTSVATNFHQDQTWIPSCGASLRFNIENGWFPHKWSGHYYTSCASSLEGQCHSMQCPVVDKAVHVFFFSPAAYRDFLALWKLASRQRFLVSPNMISLSSGIAGSNNKPICIFLRTVQTDFQSGFICLCSHSQCRTAPSPPLHPHQHGFSFYFPWWWPLRLEWGGILRHF